MLNAFSDLSCSKYYAGIIGWSLPTIKNVYIINHIFHPKILGHGAMVTCYSLFGIPNWSALDHDCGVYRGLVVERCWKEIFLIMLALFLMLSCPYYYPSSMLEYLKTVLSIIIIPRINYQMQLIINYQLCQNFFK